MRHHHLAGTAGAFAVLLIAMGALAQTNDATSSGPAANGSPAWFLAPMQGMIDTRAKPRPDAGLAGCEGDVGKFCTGQNGYNARYCLLQNVGKLSGQCKASTTAAEAAAQKANLGTPSCFRSPVCDP